MSIWSPHFPLARARNDVSSTGRTPGIPVRPCRETECLISFFLLLLLLLLLEFLFSSYPTALTDDSALYPGERRSEAVKVRWNDDPETIATKMSSPFLPNGKLQFFV